MNGISDISSAVSSSLDVLSSISAMIAVMTLIMGVFKFMRGDVAAGGFSVFLAFMIYFVPTVMLNVFDTGSDISEVAVNNSSITQKTVQATTHTIEKQVAVQEAPKKPKPVVESKPIDYKPFLYILGGIIGTILAIISLFFIISKTIKLYKFRKAYKFVTRIAGLPNDFMALSSEIDKIDLFIVKLNEMTKFYEGPKKQELMKLQVILKDKKYMFNGIINSIKAAQPELNSVYTPT